MASRTRILKDQVELMLCFSKAEDFGGLLNCVFCVAEGRGEGRGGGEDVRDSGKGDKVYED